MEFILLEDFSSFKIDKEGNKVPGKDYFNIQSKLDIDIEDIKGARTLVIPGSRKSYKNRFQISTPLGIFVVKGNYKDFVKEKDKYYNKKVVVKGFYKRAN